MTKKQATDREAIKLRREAARLMSEAEKMLSESNEFVSKLKRGEKTRIKRMEGR